MSLERYMVDDAGTLIDKVTRDNFDTVEEVVSILNHYASTLEELVDENEELKELLELISEASSFTKEESVKEILRHEIKAIDTVTEDSAMGWHDYGVLSNFFMKQYGEHWDNE